MRELMQQLHRIAEDEDSDKESRECQPPLKAARTACPVTTVASSLSTLFPGLAKALEEHEAEQSECDDELQILARIHASSNSNSMMHESQSESFTESQSIADP